MARLEDVPLEELREELASFDQRRPIIRLLAAVIYKQGPSVPQLAEWLDVREATIYAWFDRLESGPIPETVHDDPRPGRPPKLTPEERTTFFEALENPPADAGLDAEVWTPRGARRYLEETCGVSYTERHVRRIMDQADTGRTDT